MLTGERHQETVLAAMAAGAIDFVGKPYESDRVAETVANLLNE
jgi:DNA-binding NtrC family response regulator